MSEKVDVKFHINVHFLQTCVLDGPLTVGGDAQWLALNESRRLLIMILGELLSFSEPHCLHLKFL